MWHFLSDKELSRKLYEVQNKPMKYEMKSAGIAFKRGKKVTKQMITQRDRKHEMHAP